MISPSVPKGRREQTPSIRPSVPSHYCNYQVTSGGLTLRPTVDCRWPERYALRPSLVCVGVSIVGTVSAKPVSALLVKWKRGDQDALQSLMPLVYDELRRIAHRHLRAERPDHTLRSTELVHEAYLRLESFEHESSADLRILLMARRKG